MKTNHNSPCYEIVTCRPRAGITLEEARQALAALQSWAERQPGFVRRSLFEDQTQGRFVDFVVWRSKQDAEKAAESFSKSDCGAAVERLLDPEAMTMHHANEVPLTL